MGKGGGGRGGGNYVNAKSHQYGVSLNTCASCAGHSPTARAKPKSHSLTTPSFDMRMFSGFTSLWMIWGGGGEG